MDLDTRMKVYRQQLVLLDQVERTRALDPDATCYLIRAVNCLRDRLGLSPMGDVDSATISRELSQLDARTRGALMGLDPVGRAT